MAPTSYQAVEPIPETDALLFRPIEVPNKESLRNRRVAIGVVAGAVLVACIVGLASFHSKTRVHVKGLKGASVTSMMEKREKAFMPKHEYKLDGAEDGDDDVCQTSIPISNINAFKTQTECDSCCSEACTDYLSSYDEYLWTCGSSYTSSQCDYSYDTFTIYKTRLCYACCENDCTRYLGGNALETYYFC